MAMPGRTYSSQGGYRYGFNGKELYKEVAGTTTYDYGFRIYSPGLGKFLSVDPISAKYAELTPYQFASNSSIALIDIDGLEGGKKILKAISTVLVSPAILVAFDKEIREGFKDRAIETWENLKSWTQNLNKSYNPYWPIFPPSPEKSADPFSGVNVLKDLAKEYVSLFKRAANGDKKAVGALFFEAAMFLIPEERIVSGFAKGGKYFKLISKEARLLIKDLGLTVDALTKSGPSAKEIGILTKNGTRQEAEFVAKGLTGEIGENAELVYGKQGITKEQPVGFNWRDENNIFKEIRFDHDPVKGAHINVTVGKDKFAIKVNISAEQAKRIAVNEIMKNLKK